MLPVGQARLALVDILLLLQRLVRSGLIGRPRWGAKGQTLPHRGFYCIALLQFSLYSAHRLYQATRKRLASRILSESFCFAID